MELNDSLKALEGLLEAGKNLAKIEASLQRIVDDPLSPDSDKVAALRTLLAIEVLKIMGTQV